MKIDLSTREVDYPLAFPRVASENPCWIQPATKDGILWNFIPKSKQTEAICQLAVGKAGLNNWVGEVPAQPCGNIHLPTVRTSPTTVRTDHFLKYVQICTFNMLFISLLTHT